MKIKDLKSLLEIYPEDYEVFVKGTGDYENYHQPNLHERHIEHGLCGYYVDKNKEGNCVLIA